MQIREGGGGIARNDNCLQLDFAAASFRRSRQRLGPCKGCIVKIARFHFGSDDPFVLRMPEGVCVLWGGDDFNYLFCAFSSFQNAF